MLGLHWPTPDPINRRTPLDELRETLQARTTRAGMLKKSALMALAVIAALGAYLFFFKSSASIERGSLRIAKVEEVAGRRIAVVTGKIVAENPRTVSAAVAGRVDRIVLLPGAPAKQGDLVLDLVNRAVLDSELAASAELAASVLQAEKTMAEMQIQVIDKKSALSDQKAHAEIARRQQEADRKLADDRIISEIQARKSRLEAESAFRKVDEATQALAIMQSMLMNVRMAGSAQIERQRATAALRREEADSLRVRSPITGVVQEIAVTQGQEVAAGTILARMYDPTALTIVLDLPERQAANVSVNHSTSISISGTKVPGKVVRISPVVKDGVVSVEVKVDGKMPPNARPELRVEAEIYADTAERTIVVRVPEGVRPASVADVFVVDGERADRRRASFGSLLGDRIEVLDGLRPGDSVIVSGLGNHDGYEVLDLK